ncbi:MULTISPECIES: hypothetical protein [Streptomyces]|uniref:Uncharacterized protein n=1 Tax=Streptomyces siderophoricus TaxID=2802281 RepID=A0ABS1MQ87_9ACTN|nr:hypothetical protein [Streptomyces sp. 9-7]MBL1089941.1 hypothetical protein [Streptomyces sp. 9-7]
MSPVPCAGAHALPPRPHTALRLLCRFCSPGAGKSQFTAAGRRERETLDERLAEERPDNRPTDTGADDGAAPGPAEEAAVRVRDDTPRGR